MEYKLFKDTYVVRLDRGDEVLTSIKELVIKEDIKLGIINGLGASDNATVSLFNLNTKEFHKQTFTKPMEITSLIGNISRMDNEPYLHLHINLCDEENKIIGGHLNECFISVTGELFIQKIDGYVDRSKDEEIGINLWDFNKEEK